MTDQVDVQSVVGSIHDALPADLLGEHVVKVIAVEVEGRRFAYASYRPASQTGKWQLRASERHNHGTWSRIGIEDP